MDPVYIIRMKSCAISFVIFCCLSYMATARQIAVASILANSGNRIMVQAPAADEDIQPNFQAALDKAVAGDEIVVPAGHYQVMKTIVVNKPLFIHGAGMGKTILSRPEMLSDQTLSADTANSMFVCSPGTGKGNLIISGLCLKSKYPSQNASDRGSMASDIGIKLVKCMGFVVTHCRFENFGYAAVWVQHSDQAASGLISKNQFSHNVKGIDGLGLGYGVVVFGTNEQWVDDPQFGSDNFIFVEDNTFAIHRHAMAAGGCGRYVFRYNTVTDNYIGAHSGQAIDAHEARQVKGMNYYSTRAVEIYNNKVINTTFRDGSPIIPGKSAKLLVENAILIRGGGKPSFTTMSCKVTVLGLAS